MRYDFTGNHKTWLLPARVRRDAMRREHVPLANSCWDHYNVHILTRNRWLVARVEGWPEAGRSLNFTLFLVDILLNCPYGQHSAIPYWKCRQLFHLKEMVTAHNTRMYVMCASSILQWVNSKLTVGHERYVKVPQLLSKTVWWVSYR